MYYNQGLWFLLIFCLIWLGSGGLLGFLIERYFIKLDLWLHAICLGTLISWIILIVGSYILAF